MDKLSYEDQKALLCINNNMTQDQMDTFIKTYDGFTDAQNESFRAAHKAVYE